MKADSFSMIASALFMDWSIDVFLKVFVDRDVFSHVSTRDSPKLDPDWFEFGLDVERWEAWERLVALLEFVIVCSFYLFEWLYLNGLGFVIFSLSNCSLTIL